MAKLYVTEFKAQSILQGANGACMDEPGTDQSPVTISGASAQSAAFAASTVYVRLHTDAICSIKIGDNPTAATTNKRLAANQTEFFRVYPGQRVAVISNV